MGWFDEQIRERIKNDDESFSEACYGMSSVIMGKSALSNSTSDSSKIATDTIGEILKYYHIKISDTEEKFINLNEQLEYFLRPSGIMHRDVVLTEKWYQDGIGPLLGWTIKGEPVAIIPKGAGGYVFFDRQNNKQITVTEETSQQIKLGAVCFYKPFPIKELNIKDLLLYIVNSLSVGDAIMVGGATLFVTLLGLLTPAITNLIFKDVIPSGKLSLLAPVFCLLFCVSIGTALIGIVKELVMARLSTKLNIAVQSASMMRLLSLPAEFFKRYSSGELAERMQYISGLCEMLENVIFTMGLSTIFSLIYIFQIFQFAPELSVSALLVILFTTVAIIVVVTVQTKLQRKQILLSTKQSGLEFSLISGVQKIKLSGAEKRAFSKWANLYQDVASLRYNPPTILKLSAIIPTAISLIGTIAIYYSAVVSGVNSANYMAFNISYGMISAAFSSLAGVAMMLANIKPMLEMAKPLLQTMPEISTEKKVVTKISGGIELNNVSFRYNKTMPMVVDNLTLKTRPGQYIAIVGRTGCGKSTIMRLMLGFETPDKGAVYYDGKDISTLDLKSLRRKIGVVMQNGKLFQGDMYSNIVISAPWLTVQDAWEAAELAGIAEDIRNMPMGMNTLVSEGGGGISGGQRQRLMIARAIVSKPRILLFDEATSALDNVTQKIVSNSLAKLKCTRIVIAHRLSTIKDCNRIIMLDRGKIVEDGTYEELIEKGGQFAELVKRQQVNGQ